MRHLNDNCAIVPEAKPHSSLKRLILPSAVVPAILLVATCAVLADDGPAKLPADGWWVRYYITSRREGTNDDIIIKRTYSLVGTSTENGEKCRWVEMNSEQTFNAKERKEILKFLIPGKELLESEKPLNSLVRAWGKFDDEPVEELKFNQPLGVRGSVASADFVWGRDMVILPGPQRKATLVNERKVVEYQQGRLEMTEGRTGKHVATRQAVTVVQKQTVALEFTVWNHTSLAPAFAAAKTRFEILIDDAPRAADVSEWVIEDFGTDAKSAMPDKN
jgi:hypothetical protein